MSFENDFVTDAVFASVVGAGTAASLGWLLNLRGKPMLALLAVCVVGSYFWSTLRRFDARSKNAEAIRRAASADKEPVDK